MSPRPADEERRLAARRSAWTLALVVVLIYAGYLAWNLLRSTG